MQDLFADSQDFQANYSYSYPKSREETHLPEDCCVGKEINLNESLAIGSNKSQKLGTITTINETYPVKVLRVRVTKCY